MGSAKAVTKSYEERDFPALLVSGTVHLGAFGAARAWSRVLELRTPGFGLHFCWSLLYTVVASLTVTCGAHEFCYDYSDSRGLLRCSCNRTVQLFRLVYYFLLVMNARPSD